MKLNRLAFLRRNKNRNAARPSRIRILVGSIAVFAASLLSLGTVSKTEAATLVFDSDGTSLGGNLNGITEGAGTFSWIPGTTLTFINQANPTTEVFTTNNLTTDIAQFGFGGTLNGTTTINVGAGATVYNITGLIFGNTLGNGYTLVGNSAGNVLTLGASGITMNAGAQVTTIGDATNLSLSIGAAQTWTNASANALNINGSIANAGNFLLTLNASGAGAINLTGVIGASTGGVTVNSTGSGIVTLSGTNRRAATSRSLRASCAPRMPALSAQAASC